MRDKEKEGEMPGRKKRNKEIEENELTEKNIQRTNVKKKKKKD